MIQKNSSQFRRFCSFSIKYSCSAFLLFCLTLLSLHSEAATEIPHWTDIHWKVMKSPRLDVVYDANHQELAEYYYKKALVSMAKVESQFQHRPEKLLLILRDETDQTNGYVTPLPYTHMVIYPVLPSAQSSIGDYGDWEEELVTHEYTHVVTIEVRRGVVKGLSYLFGTLMTPNVLLPRWWLEGIAVEMETRLSTHGRLRSTAQDAGIRALLLDKKLTQVDFAEINESTIPTWPYGARPYFYGSYLWSEMLKQEEASLANALSEEHSGRIPYFIGTPLYRLTGKTYMEFFEETKADLQKRSEKQIQDLSVAKPTAAGVVPKIAGEGLAPTISADGKFLAYVRVGKNLRRSVQVLQRPNLSEPFSGEYSLKGDESDKNEALDKSPIPRIDSNSDNGEDGPPTGSISLIRWFHKQPQFIYDKVDSINRFEERSDLHIYSLLTKKSEQITTAARLREPAVSPDDQNVVAVQLAAGKTNIVILKLADKSLRTVLNGQIGERFSTPLYLNEKEILFAYRKNGQETFRLFNLETQKQSDFLPSITNVKAPQMTAQGLIFSSAQTGVNNVYLYDFKNKSLRPLTHTLTGIDYSAIDPLSGDLYISQLTIKGTELARIEKAQLFSGKNLPQVKPLMADRYPAQKAAAAETAVKIDPYEIEDYSSTYNLWPHYWLPLIFADSQSTYYSFSTGGQDPLGKNIYSIAAAYDTKVNGASFSAQYVNNFFEPQLLAVASRYRIRYLGSSVENVLSQYILGSVFELRSISRHLNTLVTAKLQETELNNTKLQQYGPTVGLVYDNTSFSPVLQAVESGVRLSATYSNYFSKDELSKFDEANASYMHYWRKWLPEEHVLYSHLQGSSIEKDISTSFYTPSIAADVFLLPKTSQLLMRGYLSSQFLMKNYAAWNLEYRFPISHIYRGHETWPIFLKNLHGAVVFDGMQGDGIYYQTESTRYFLTDQKKLYSSYGVELKANTTVGYHIPISFVLGVYAPANKEVNKDNQVLFTLRM